MKSKNCYLDIFTLLLARWEFMKEEYISERFGMFLYRLEEGSIRSIIRSLIDIEGDINSNDFTDSPTATNNKDYTTSNHYV